MQGERKAIDWASLGDLVCTLAGGALLWLLPQTGPWALALALLSWLVRLWRREPLFKRTPLDLPLALFLVTAGVGAWASYDGGAAIAKLWLILAGALLFYAIAGQPPQNLPWVYAQLSAAGAGIALYFLFTFDWSSMPADLDFIQRLGTAWAAVRPRLPGLPPHPNIAGGLIALLAPFMLVLLRDAWQGKHLRLLIFSLTCGGIAAIGLLMSSSRAAWLALGAGMGTWLLWWLVGRLGGMDAPRRGLIFAASIGVLLGVGLLLAVSYPGGPAALFERLPGPNSAGSRLEIARGALRLIGDFPYTGGGLHSFAGLYSHYILGIPFFLFNYAHNLYLDLALEQGVAGLCAFLLILAGAAWLLIRQVRSGAVSWAVLASGACLIVLAVHGLADDPLYAGRGTPFLLLAPGMAVALSRQTEHAERLPHRQNARLGLVAAILAVLAALAFALRQPLLSSWYANLGSVRMARVELTGFPTGEFEDGSRVDEMMPAEDDFIRALELDPGNATAHYRLGLVNLLRRDFPAAQAHLQQSLASDPRQRGARKYLALVYVWNGEYEQAQALMRSVPGIRQELEAYVTWWREQGHPELAQRAEEMLADLP